MSRISEQMLHEFLSKGGVYQPFNDNGLKVRRVTQLVADAARKPFQNLRILDLACGEGVYAIEAAMHGASVVGIDARHQRMELGIRAAQESGLSNLRFERNDVRRVTKEAYGQFDVIYFLGILYHLEAESAFSVLENIYAMCDGLLIIDTHVSLKPTISALYKGRSYAGSPYKEFDSNATEAQKYNALLASIDNPQSFWFTLPDLVRLLTEVGFSSVVQCHAPLEPTKPEDRVTLLAFKGERVQVSVYPWVNGISEDEIRSKLPKTTPAPNRLRLRLRSLMARIRRRLPLQ